jgi:hypothetical protein
LMLPLSISSTASPTATSKAPHGPRRPPKRRPRVSVMSSAGGHGPSPRLRSRLSPPADGRGPPSLHRRLRLSHPSLPLLASAVLCRWPPVRSPRSAWHCCREDLRRRCCGSGWLRLPLHPQPPLSLASALVLVCWSGLLRAASPSLPAGRLLAPSLVDRRSILAGLLLILSSFHALDCTLLLHQLVCHPHLRGRLRGVGFCGLAKASSDLCRGLLLPGETDDGGVLVVPSLVALSCLTSSLASRCLSSGDVCVLGVLVVSRPRLPFP